MSQVAPLSVVEVVDEVVDVLSCLQSVFKYGATFEFESGKEALGRRVVPAVALAAHTLAKPVVPLVGRAKAFSPGWFALEGASTAADAYLLHAAALEQARAIQAELVDGLLARFAEIQDKPVNDPAMIAFCKDAPTVSTWPPSAPSLANMASLASPMLPFARFASSPQASALV